MFNGCAVFPSATENLGPTRKTVTSTENDPMFPGREMYFVGTEYRPEHRRESWPRVKKRFSAYLAHSIGSIVEIGGDRGEGSNHKTLVLGRGNIVVEDDEF